MQTLNYTGLIGVLTKEIQDLKTCVKDLKKRVQQLELKELKELKEL